MTVTKKRKAAEVMLDLFLALPDDALGNLLWHVRAKTRILAGPEGATRWTSNRGGG